jgi:hypothetical protein
LHFDRLARRNFYFWGMDKYYQKNCLTARGILLAVNLSVALV